MIQVYKRRQEARPVELLLLLGFNSTSRLAQNARICKMAELWQSLSGDAGLEAEQSLLDYNFGG